MHGREKINHLLFFNDLNNILSGQHHEVHNVSDQLNGSGTILESTIDYSVEGP